jgi:ribosomal protein S18 acetylase RimI-like enzyme
MTDRTWYLYWIAVAKEGQSRGLGAEMLRAVEADIRRRDGRLFLIETSSLPHYEPTRRFYLAKGYEQALRARRLLRRRRSPRGLPKRHGSLAHET